MQVPEAGSKGNYSPSTSLSQSDTSPTPVALHTAARRRQRVVLDSDDEASPGGATPALDHRNDAIIETMSLLTMGLSANLVGPQPKAVTEATAPLTMRLGADQSQLGSPATADTVVLITDSDSDEGLGDCITWTSVRKTRPNRSRLDDVLDDDDALWIDQENAVPPTNLLRTPAPPVPATAVKPPRVPATPTAKAPATAPAKGRVRDVGLGAEVLTGAAFKKQRQALAHALFHRFNATVFDGQLPTDLEINWNAHLKTTAGLTRYTRELPSELFGETQYSARVELSIKVLDSSDKLERTLCHELCHVAAWLLDHSAKPPHGAVFKRWAAAAMRAHPHLRITTCHNYEIHAPFQWQCTRPTCARVYKRHSKSIDPAKQGCGMCKGKLVPLGKFNPDGTPAKARPANAYSLFIKDNFASAKKACPPGTPHGEVMKKLATQWKARKAA
ncbi:hypothetical protein WJX72_011199 [[Myrmecia] bisecta]|uniref:HMG box domain-containing protein n=1 Tax=[Myrmecia] bisecta TaxID=41462 RepID=A0AAW1Q6J0_9CHLO